METDNIPAIFLQRGIGKDTVAAFAPFITLIRDKRNGKFDGYNVGFPYTDTGGRVKGYEIRGHGGYKSKAAGTDSSTAAWVADLSRSKGFAVRSIFFCESALDAMAFYQINKVRVGTDTALVSLGGTFSDRQVTGVMARFTEARAFDCFDNDLAGRIYGLRMMALLEGIPMKISKADGGLLVEAKGKSFRLDPDRPLPAQVGKNLPIRYKVGHWPPPKAFKDWNDCLMNRPMEPVILPNKNDREMGLAERRNTGIKI